MGTRPLWVEHPPRRIEAAKRMESDDDRITWNLIGFLPVGLYLNPSNFERRRLTTVLPITGPPE